jgi:hypothetical protein
MKYNINFIQISNWIYLLKEKLENIKDDDNTVKELLKQKEILLKTIDIINKKTRLIGIQKKFLENYKDLKRKLDANSTV